MNSKCIVIKELKRDMSTSETLEFNKMYLLDEWLGHKRGYTSGAIMSNGGLLYSAESKKYIVVSVNSKTYVRPDEYQNKADDYFFNTKSKKFESEDNHVTNHQKVKNCLLKLDKKYKSLVEAARSKDELFQELQHLIGADL